MSLTEITKSVLLVVVSIILCIIVFSLFVYLVGTSFIKFLLSIPLTYLWSIGFFAVILYFIRKRVK